MSRTQSILREISLKITDSQRPLWSLGDEVNALHDLLQTRAEFQIDSRQDIAAGETRTDHGLAVSATQAAMCAREIARTAAFVRGITQAIQDIHRRCSGRPVRVLYAGCGPYALLAVPQMSLFTSDQIQFVLLDIHEESITSARSVVESLGFTKHVARYVHGDGCHYDSTAGSEPDLIISETMNVCLANEPLVMIARHLLSQSNAIMVPRSVRVVACLVDESKEFVFSEPEHVGDHRAPRRDRVLLGNVFELNEENARRWGASPGDRLPASRVTIPSPLEARYRPMLFTTVNVYGDIALQEYDCSLTLPRPIATNQPLHGGEVLRFEYRLGKNPGLECTVAACD